MAYSSPSDVWVTSESRIAVEVHRIGTVYVNNSPVFIDVPPGIMK
jgi:hypothetical protein